MDEGVVRNTPVAAPRSKWRSFIHLPPECRSLIYRQFLNEHQIVTRLGIHVQPISNHLSLLRVCRRVYHEAHNILWEYISLRTDAEIAHFLVHVGPQRFSLVTWVDVKIDDRNVVNWETFELLPASRLRFALRLMTAIRRVRAFIGETLRERPLRGLPNAPPWFLHRDPEYAMCGTLLKLQHVESYELFVTSRTLVRLFKTVIPDQIHTLRISGACFLPERQPDLRHLKRLSIHNVILGPFLDNLINPTSTFYAAPLESLAYSQVYTAINVLQDRHLQGIVSGPGRNLRSLTLMGPMRVSTAVLVESLDRLPQLEYFALFLVYTFELGSDVLAHLPSMLQTFKFRIRNASHVRVLLEREMYWANYVESHLLRTRPFTPFLRTCHLDFRRSIIDTGGRRERWLRLANLEGIDLHVDLWYQREFDG